MNTFGHQDSPQVSESKKRRIALRHIAAAALFIIILAAGRFPAWAQAAGGACSPNGITASPTAAGTTVQCTGGVWVTVGGGGASLSDLTAATGANTINNVANTQTWNWNSVTTGSGLVLGSTSVTSGAVLSVTAGNNTSTGSAILGTTNTLSTGAAIKGTATGASGVNYGVFGSAASSNGIGVYGGGNAYGVYGSAATGIAVYGTSSSGYGVYGSTAGAGQYGIYCYSGSNVNGCGGNRAWYNASDVRLKKDIADLDPEMGLNAVMKLRPVTYHWRMGDTKKTELGFIAQDVEQILPELVGKGPDAETVTDDGTKEKVTNVRALSYGSFVVPLVKAVQELKADNDNLRTLLKETRAEVDLLKSKENH